MKVVILHPPLYPVNHEFFNELGKHVTLVVFSFGNHPSLHDGWKVSDFLEQTNTYQLKIIEGTVNAKRKSISYRTQLNPIFLNKVKKEKPDIVISIAFWFPSLYMALFKKIIKCKFLILTDAIRQTENNISITRKLIRKIIAFQTDAFIACSDLTASYLKEQFPTTEVKKSFQTIDVVKWKEGIEKLDSKNELRTSLELSNDKIIILSIGNFIPLKNLESLIDQVPLILNCQLILIGQGFLKSSFEEKINNLNLSDRVKLVNPINQEELKKYYKAADIFIFPTNRDTFGYVALEALASGLPIICSKNSGVSCIVNDGSNGFLISPKDNFTNKIKETIKNLSEMSLNAQQSSGNFTLKKRVKENIEIFQTVLYDS